MRVIMVIFLFLGCSGCPPFPPPQPIPTPTDAAPAPTTVDSASADQPIVLSDCQIACANLYQAGCAEATRHGQDVCVRTCDHIQQTRFIDLDVKCLVKAETVYAIKLCGVKCPK